MSRAFRLGVFIVAALMILATGSVIIGEHESLFIPTYPVVTMFKTVAGLSEGAEVRVGGIHSGTVRRIAYPTAPGGEMAVFMDLERSTRSVVRSDSIASISTEGLLGNKFVEVSFGSESAPPIPRGGAIPSAPPLDISDLMKKTNDVLDSGRATLAKIDDGQGTVGALVNDKRVYSQLNEATAQAQEGAAAFKDDMEALKHNFFLRGFFNNRGYDDPAQLTEHLIAALPRAQALRTFHYDVKKLFVDVDHAKLKNEQATNDAGRFLEQTPFGLAVVVASSGMKGDSAELQALLQARAMVIRDYLVTHFRMDDTRVRTMEVGKSAATASDAGAIDLIVYPASVTPPPLVKPRAVR